MLYRYPCDRLRALFRAHSRLSVAIRVWREERVSGHGSSPAIPAWSPGTGSYPHSTASTWTRPAPLLGFVTRRKPVSTSTERLQEDLGNAALRHDLCRGMAMQITLPRDLFPPARFQRFAGGVGPESSLGATPLNADGASANKRSPWYKATAQIVLTTGRL